MVYSEFVEKVSEVALSRGDYHVCACLRKCVFSDFIETMATNGKNIFINPKFLDTLSTDETVAVLAHELGHDMLVHDKLSRDKAYWAYYDAGSGLAPETWHYLCNVAMDIVINEDLRFNGYTLPDGALFREALNVPKDLELASEIFKFLLADYKQSMQNMRELSDALKKALSDAMKESQERDSLSSEPEQTASMNGYPTGSSQASNNEKSSVKKQKKAQLDKVQEELDKQQKELDSRRGELEQEGEDSAKASDRDNTNNNSSNSGSGNINKQREELDKQQEELDQKKAALDKAREELDNEEADEAKSDDFWDSYDKKSDEGDNSDDELSENSEGDESDKTSDDTSDNSGSDAEETPAIPGKGKSLKEIGAAGVSSSLKAAITQEKTKPSATPSSYSLRQRNWIDQIFEYAGRHLASINRTRTYRVPSRRGSITSPDTGIVVPFKGTLSQSVKPKVCFYLDCSGSMGDLPESIVAALMAKRHLLGATKSLVYPFATYLSKEPIDLKYDVDLNTISDGLGGGTNMRAVIEDINMRSVPSDIACIITDADTTTNTDLIDPHVFIIIVTDSPNKIIGEARPGRVIIGVNSFKIK